MINHATDPMKHRLIMCLKRSRVVGDRLIRGKTKLIIMRIIINREGLRECLTRESSRMVWVRLARCSNSKNDI